MQRALRKFVVFFLIVVVILSVPLLVWSVNLAAFHAWRTALPDADLEDAAFSHRILVAMICVIIVGDILAVLGLWAILRQGRCVHGFPVEAIPDSQNDDEH